jgi:hypothetical protein
MRHATRRVTRSRNVGQSHFLMATDTRKTAADRGIGGSVSIIWACLFKSPPVSYTDAEAAGQMERFAGDLSK